jgi:hypothetical protein
MTATIRANLAFRITPEHRAEANALLADIHKEAATEKGVEFTSAFATNDPEMSLEFGFENHNQLDHLVSRLGPTFGKLETFGGLADLHFYGQLDKRAQQAFEAFKPQFHPL